jgi:chemotaxis protein methyltransferase CheR
VALPLLATIEETLRQLKAAMELHRRSLATAAPPPVATGRTMLSGPLAAIAAEIERSAGVAVVGAVAAKLERLFAGSDGSALSVWLERIRGAGSLHADLQLVIESLTTHETYFFRDPGQLDLLRVQLGRRISRLGRAGTRRLRLWSAGCSTGEEAYSLAIVAQLALADAGEAMAAGWTVEVLGSDISGRAVEIAERAYYGTAGLSPFRALPSELERYFSSEPGGAGRVVAPGLKRLVRFSRFNLLDAAPPILDCDVVACRNVLIYLTAPAAAHVQRLLQRALASEGILLLGPTDSLIEPERYETVWAEKGIVHVLATERA